MYSEENISVVHQFFGVSGDTARLFLYLTHQGLQQFFSLIYFKHSLGILELKSVFYISILLTKYNYFWNFSFFDSVHLFDENCLPNKQKIRV